MAPVLVTLNDLEGHFPRSFPLCRPFQVQSVEHLCSILPDFNWQHVARSLSDSWASCMTCLRGLSSLAELLIWSYFHCIVLCSLRCDRCCKSTRNFSCRGWQLVSPWCCMPLSFSRCWLWQVSHSSTVTSWQGAYPPKTFEQVTPHKLSSTVAGYGHPVNLFFTPHAHVNHVYVRT